MGGASHDVTAEAGFLALLDLAMRLVPGGIIVGAPPCPLFVFLRLSFHRPGREQGDTSKLPVRLASAIVGNTMVLIEVVHLRGVWFVLEQPASSWMFKLPCVRETFARLKGRQPRGGRPVVCQARGCQPGGGPPGVDSPAVLRICIWMGAFGHELPKCSHLVGLCQRCRP